MSTRNMASAMTMRGLTGSQFRVLVNLAYRAGDDGLCQPDTARLAAACELAESTVKGVLVDLRRLGYITTDRRHISVAPIQKAYTAGRNLP